MLVNRLDSDRGLEVLPTECLSILIYSLHLFERRLRFGIHVFPPHSSSSLLSVCPGAQFFMATMISTTGCSSRLDRDTTSSAWFLTSQIR